MRFSIVVPVYKVEKYLDECVKSLLKQTYTDFEIILVDDKSPDNCPKMCDGYAKSDSRVRVIHKPKNEGLGFARNTGIEAALGDYIMFVDSDDTIDSKTLEKCSVHLEDEPDILVFGIKLCHENKKGVTVRTESLIPENFCAATRNEMAEMFYCLSDARVFQYACNKAYRREFIQKLSIRFEETKLIEDFLYNINVFEYAEYVRSISDEFYYYRKPAHVTLASSYNPHFFELAKRKFSLEEGFLHSHNLYDGKYLQQILKGYIKHYISAVARNCSKNANLGFAQQKRLAKQMLEDSVTQRVLQTFEAKNKIYALITYLMKKKMSGCMVIIGSMSNCVQRKILPLVSSLKR